MHLCCRRLSAYLRASPLPKALVPFGRRITPFSRRSFSMENNTVDLDALSASVTKQGAIVRQLKKDGADPQEISVGKWAVDDVVDQPLTILLRSSREAQGSEGRV